MVDLARVIARDRDLDRQTREAKVNLGTGRGLSSIPSMPFRSLWNDDSVAPRRFRGCSDLLCR